MSKSASTSPWADLAIDLNTVFWNASYVVAHRTKAAMTGRMTVEECGMMWVEKPLAFASSMHNGTTAALLGGHPAWVAQTALAPVERRTRSNADRLQLSDDSA